jgi:hypothetical protein
MSNHRAARAALVIVSVASAWLTPWLSQVPAARAQEPAGATLVLESQTPYTTVKTPQLRITVAATNTTSVTMTALSVFVTIGQPIRSLTQYGASLTAATLPFPLSIHSFAQTGSLKPGQTRLFRVQLDVSTAGLDPSDSLVYPVQVDLRSLFNPPVAAVNSALLNLVRKPESRLRLGWWAEITARPAFNPQGQLADPSFEASIGPAGSLGAEVAALRALVADPTTATPIDVAIEPAVVEQLARMASGYVRANGTVVAKGQGASADAATILSSLRAIAAAPTTQIDPMPFSAPLIPSLLSGGLSADLDRQNAAGAAVLSSALGVTVNSPVSRPPAGALDDASVDALSRGGVTTILGDFDTVPRPLQPDGFEPLPTAALTTTSGNPVNLVLPDPGTETLLADRTMQGDPVRQAQVILGEIAAIWREEPVPEPQPDGSATVRGVAVGLPSGLPAGLWSPLIRRLSEAPFLSRLHAQDFAADVNPGGPVETLSAPSTASFTRFYTDAIRDERRDAEAYRSMLAVPSTVPDQLEQDLLYAEAGVYVGAEVKGRAWFDQVHTVTDGVFSQVLPPRSTGPPTYTFTSSVGRIPIQMGDPGTTPLTVIVQLRSAWFSFPNATQTVTLDRPNQVVTFVVKATAGSQEHPIVMVVRAPSGRVLDSRTLAVRTAAVNLIALVVTAAAALGLVVLWARRLLRLRRSRRGSHAA